MIYKKVLALFAVIALAFMINGCSSQNNEQVADYRQNGEEGFTVKLICDSEEVYIIAYEFYLGGESAGFGMIADIDHRPLNETEPFTMKYGSSYFEGKDLQDLYISLAPYGKGDDHEITVTEPVKLNPAEGKTYLVTLVGSKEAGFKIELKEE